MPLVSRYFIKSGLLFMVLSLIVAVVVNAPAAWQLPDWAGALDTTHLHLFVVGWITQIIFGVALWFFPKWSREKPRGPEWLSWSCWGALNAGLLLRAVSEAGFAAGFTGGMWPVMMVVAAVLQWAAAVLFAIAIWPRVKGRKKRTRS